MTEQSAEDDPKSRLRSTALKHALNIEEKKKLKARVTDLVLEAYDLPSGVEADPATPTPADAILFRECLSLFQPSDFNDLVLERNIDNRCGYALCPKPNRKLHGSGSKVWNHKGGNEFKILDRAEVEKWCSKECGRRAAFVYAQLRSEPSWVRDDRSEVRLLEDMGKVEELSDAIQSLAASGAEGEITQRLKALSLERADNGRESVPSQVSITERMNVGSSSVPLSQGHQSIEGHEPRRVHFAQK